MRARVLAIAPAASPLNGSASLGGDGFRARRNRFGHRSAHAAVPP
jgi:hypothetical protein